jgi:hypothetical protein
MAKAKQVEAGTALVASDRMPALAPMNLADLGTVLAKSGFFSDSRSANQAMVKVLAGKELGVGPITAMTGIYIIQGRVSLSANLMAGVIRRSGKHDFRIVKLDETECVLMATLDGKDVAECTFSMADAVKAELTTGKNKHSWNHYPRNMLFSRAISNLAKWYCPDVFSGPVYTPDELDCTVNDNGEAINVAFVGEASDDEVAGKKKSFAEIQAEKAAADAAVVDAEFVVTPDVSEEDAKAAERAAELEVERMREENNRKLADAEAEGRRLMADNQPKVKAAKAADPTPAAALNTGTAPPALPAAATSTAAHSEITTDSNLTSQFAGLIVKLGYKTDPAFKAAIDLILKNHGVAKFSALGHGAKEKIIEWLETLHKCLSLACDLGYAAENHREKFKTWLKQKTGCEAINLLPMDSAQTLILAFGKEKAKRAVAAPSATGKN